MGPIKLGAIQLGTFILGFLFCFPLSGEAPGLRWQNQDCNWISYQRKIGTLILPSISICTYYMEIYSIYEGCSTSLVKIEEEEKLVQNGIHRWIGHSFLGI